MHARAHGFRIAALLALPAALVMLEGCRGSGGGTNGFTDQALRAQIAAHGLTGNPMAGRTIPAPDSPLAQLGARLFFSKALEVTGTPPA